MNKKEFNQIVEIFSTNEPEDGFFIGCCKCGNTNPYFNYNDKDGFFLECFECKSTSLQK